MGNCLESCHRHEASKGDESSKVHVEDVLLKNPQHVKMVMNGDVEVEKPKKAMKKVRFCGVDEKDSKEEVRSSSDNSGGCAGTTDEEGFKVRIVLTKQEAAILLPLLEAGGGGKTIEELIGKLMNRHGSSFVPSLKLKDGREDSWTPVLQSIPENESV